MKNLLTKIVVGLLLSSFMLMSAGCYGSFGLTKKVYHWNGTMGGKWENELVFLVLNVIPVYSIAVSIDAIILNSIEFWTGKSPIASTVQSKDGATVTLNSENKAVTVNYDKQTVTLVREKGVTVAKDSQGRVIAYAVANPQGGLNIIDSNGKVLRTYSSEQVNALAVAE